jgi:hypothetical protein
MQLGVPTMSENFAFAALVAKGKALWHGAQSISDCPDLASVLQASGHDCVTKLIVFPYWGNLGQSDVFATMAEHSIVSIN